MKKRVKVSLPPFVHTGKGLSILWTDLIVGFAPVLILSFIADFNKLLIFVISVLGFIISGVVPRIITSKSIPFKISILKYVLWGMIFTVIIPGSIPVSGIIFAVLGAGLIEEIIAGTGLAVFPAFTVAWIFLGAAYNLLQDSFHIYLIYPAVCGAIYFFIKRRISVFVLIGTLVSFLAGLTYISKMNPDYIVIMGVVTFLILGYPGMVPGSNKGRVIFGLLCGSLILNYGIWGFFVSLIFSPLIDRI